MTILIGKYEFDGPYNSTAYLEEKQGLYAVLHCENDEYELIHLAQAENVKEKIELSQSAYNSITGTVVLAACYTPRSSSRERNKMVDEIHSEFDDHSDQQSDKRLLAEAAS